MFFHSASFFLNFTQHFDVRNFFFTDILDFFPVKYFWVNIVTWLFSLLLLLYKQYFVHLKINTNTNKSILIFLNDPVEWKRRTGKLIDKLLLIVKSTEKTKIPFSRYPPLQLVSGFTLTLIWHLNIFFLPPSGLLPTHGQISGQYQVKMGHRYKQIAAMLKLDTASHIC